MTNEEYIKTLKKIFENYSEITGIQINGLFYNIDCINTDIISNYDLSDEDELQEVLENNYEFLLKAYQLDENDCYLEYEFSIKDIIEARNVVLYKLQKI